MEDINALLQGLKVETNDNKIEENLKKIISNSKDYTVDDVDTFKGCFNKANDSIKRLTAQAIAELSKQQCNRDHFTDVEIIEHLLSLLNVATDAKCLLQTCRALGNICYENDDARKIVKSEGLVKVKSIIETHYGSVVNCELVTVECGFLLNLLMSNDDLQKLALESNVPELVVKVLNTAVTEFNSYEACVTHLLLILNMLVETMAEPWISEELSSKLLQILTVSVNPEISELSLELLHAQAEDDDIKLCLAKDDACQKLHTLIEDHVSMATDDESRALLKLACDLIVLILTGEESMKLLYGDGNGKVYDNAVSWLESNDTDFVITGALSIGNFARNDQHCIKMVQSGLSKKLIAILKRNNTNSGDVRLQHAVLSALRNLVIPAANKEQMLNEGLLDVLYPMMSVEQSPVVFKLLGTMRMAIDGQEKVAIDLLQRKELLEKLVEWCVSSDHPGVRGEAPRLLAWMIKHSRSSTCLGNILTVKDCIKCLVEMIPSSHTVMQNEALLALNLCAHTMLKDVPCRREKTAASVDLAKLLVDSDIGKVIPILLNKYGDKLDKEIVQNLLLLIKVLCKADAVVVHFKCSDVSVSLRKLAERHDLSDLHCFINEMAQACDTGTR